MLKIINFILTILLTLALLLLSVFALAQPTSPFNKHDDRKKIDQKSQSTSSSTNGTQNNPALVNPINPSDMSTPRSTVHPSSPIGINPSNPAGVDQSSPTGGTGGSSGYQ
ncbi:hypothetical protein [Nitrosomonas sp. Nm166]|uniref:hypothetical protein n=1 Tax=Nitrosomonas sp. Nm166 TaxID=1881054 RepID=UPI0008E8B44C|nr:hypothetical protein [Nitrosomonas sp. Nm166]SFE61348.1 hypothetical protein SAMN05428977_102223 [Nitrosomonas sp. Nm166]